MVEKRPSKIRGKTSYIIIDFRKIISFRNMGKVKLQLNAKAMA